MSILQEKKYTWLTIKRKRQVFSEGATHTLKAIEYHSRVTYVLTDTFYTSDSWKIARVALVYKGQIINFFQQIYFPKIWKISDCTFPTSEEETAKSLVGTVYNIHWKREGYLEKWVLLKPHIKSPPGYETSIFKSLNGKNYLYRLIPKKVPNPRMVSMCVL